MRARTIFPMLCCILAGLPILAQEQLGLKLGNYSGVQSLQLNPSWQVSGPLKWDVNIVAGGIFMEQDYIYGQKGSLLRLMNRGAGLATGNSGGGNDATVATGEVPFYFQDRRTFNLQENAIVMMPSFMANIGEHSFGVYFTARSWASGYKLDGELGYSTLIDTSLFVGNIDKFQIGAANWSEAAVAYARNIKKTSRLEVNAGATVKFLLGFDGMSLQNKTAVDVVRDGEEIAMGPSHLDISYATGYSEADGYTFRRRGFGAAADIGFTLVSPPSGNSGRPYKWKLGLSLIDIGRIWYRRDASAYTYSSMDSSHFNTANFESVRDPDQLIEAINSSGNEAQAVLTNTQFGVLMPMAASIQFDAPLADRFYISGTAVIGMRYPVRANAIERRDMLAVTPRFEARWFEIGLPVSLYRWTEFSVGAYFRVGPLTIGTENLNSWLIPGKLEGSDVYFALKINSGMFGKSGGKRGEGCYALP